MTSWLSLGGRFAPPPFDRFSMGSGQRYSMTKHAYAALFEPRLRSSPNATDHQISKSQPNLVRTTSTSVAAAIPCPSLLSVAPILAPHTSQYRMRHGMIFFGDIDFFTSDAVRNKSGQRLWLRFLELLEAGGHVYRDGLPVVCEAHKTRADLSTPEAFDEQAPDGGCRVVCGVKLACDGRHPCPRRCQVVEQGCW